MKTYYELLGLTLGASTDEIKRAFRAEIARYHPDKVQHLGVEFQEIAATRAAQLTEAYRVLMNEDLRADYDRQLQAGGVVVAPPPPSAAPPTAKAGPGVAEPPPAEAPPAEPAGAGRLFEAERARRDDFLRRASLERLRQVLSAEFGGLEEHRVRGFDLACVSRPKLFTRVQHRVLGRMVDEVNGPVIQETVQLVAKAGQEWAATVCVFVLAPRLAPRGELAQAITAERRRARHAAMPPIVPLDVRDWTALMPSDAPALARALVERLRAQG